LNIAWNSYFVWLPLSWFTEPHTCRWVKLDWNIKIEEWKNKINKTKIAHVFHICKVSVRLRPGLNPRTWVPKVSTLTPRPPKPHLGDIRRNYKIKNLILCSECVRCNDILGQGFTQENREIQQVITAVPNTYCIVYWYVVVNTDLYKGDVKVQCVAVVTSMADYSWNTKNSSTRIGESGAHPHRERGGIRPVDSKITMFILNMKLIEYYIMNCIGILVMNILCVCVCMCVCVCVCVYRVINDLWHLL
jgi:hypothetical protein